jgi:membrane protein implicated in regulation of membrane protease activity
MLELLNTLFWIGTIAGGIMVLLLLISIFAGIEAGGDVDSPADASDGSFGIIKTLLTFISVGAFTARAILLNTSWSWPIATFSALAAGIIAVVLLTWFFRWLLSNQEEGTWHLWQAEGKMGVVYVPIPPNGKGRILVQIDNAKREISAQSQDGEPMHTHDKVMILEARENYVIVAPLE